MRILTPLLVLLLPVAAMAAPPVAAPRPAPPQAEIALTYHWLHTNAPPDDCGCFSMNGGSASFAWRFSPSFSAVVEGGAVANGNVATTGPSQTGLGLTLAQFLAGARYTYRKSPRFQPFGQVLLGAAHTSGSLSPDQIGVGSSNAFAMAAGGGADLNLTPHFALRLVQVDYNLTTLPNRTTGTQNNLRLGAGVVFRFGGK